MAEIDKIIIFRSILYQFQTNTENSYHKSCFCNARIWQNCCVKSENHRLNKSFGLGLEIQAFQTT